LLDFEKKKEKRATYVFNLQYLPPVDSRSMAGFVGLKNGGATCYMNSVLQQLFMCPSVPESILRIEDDSLNEDRSVSSLNSMYLFL
jgi:ubiquitin carboxyl-terminal hydrolase 9/24